MLRAEVQFPGQSWSGRVAGCDQAAAWIEWLRFEFDGPSPEVLENRGELQTAAAGEEDFASILDRMRPPTANGDMTADEVWREAIRGGCLRRHGSRPRRSRSTTVERDDVSPRDCHAGHTPFVRS